MSDRPNIFDKLGNVDSLSEEQIEALDDAAREDYFAVVETALAARDAEQAVADGRANLKALVSKFNDLQSTFDKVGKVDRISEARRVILVQNAIRAGIEPPPAPKPDPKLAKMAKAIETADAEVAEAREMLGRLEYEANAKRAAMAKAIQFWQIGAAPKDPNHVYREHLRRQKEHELSGKGAVEAPYVSMSHLDDVLRSGAGGRHNAINQGHRRPQRGHTVKLPSRR
jgi:hypothetical protein